MSIVIQCVSSRMALTLYNIHCFTFFCSSDSLIPIMDSTTRTASEKKECKSSGLDANSFSDLPKKPSPTTMSRGVKAY